MIKAVIYKPEHCPKCEFSKKRMQFEYSTVVLDPDRDKQMFDDFRIKGYSSFPVIQIFDEDIRVDEWNDLNFAKIDHWNNIYMKQKLD